jgi:hypothetical protein
MCTSSSSNPCSWDSEYWFSTVVASSGVHGQEHDSDENRAVCRPNQRRDLFIPSISLGVTSKVLARLSLPPLGPGPGCFIVMSAMSIGAAAVSWHFFEQPLNRLKERLYVFPRMSVLPVKDISTNAREPEGG